jgi:hypothetical protein
VTAIAARPMRGHRFCVRSIEFPAHSRWVVLVSAVSLWAVVDAAEEVEPTARQMLAECGAGARFGLHVVRVRYDIGVGDPEQFATRSSGLYRWYPALRVGGSA